MAMTYLDRQEPVLRLMLWPAETAAEEKDRIEILVTRPTEQHDESRPRPIEDDEPTWEDAEWQ